MANGKHTGRTVALCALTAVLSVNATLLAVRNYPILLPSYGAQKTVNKVSEIQAVIDTRYVGAYDPDEVADLAAVGVLAGLGDRWSHYLTQVQYEDYKTDFAGQLVGIGVSVSYDEAAQAIHISDVYDGSPAEAAGLARGDWILGAAGRTVREHGYDDVVNAVRGPEGTEVTLTVRKGDGTESTLAVTRARVDKTVVRYRMLTAETGYLSIRDFDGSADKQFFAALDALQAQGARRLIFDVRNNPGGSVAVLSHILDPLLPEGPIITLEPKSGRPTTYRSDAAALEMPMAVLVNAQSISAAEFFAAALQEYGKALVVGEKTIGKGYSQRQYPLSDGSCLLLSDQKYYTPHHRNLADVGVTPDLAVDLPEEAAQHFYFMTDEEDVQLAAALQALETGAP